MHKDRVMRQLNEKLDAHSEQFIVEPDYGSIMSKKFSNYHEQDEENLVNSQAQKLYGEISGGDIKSDSDDQGDE